MIRSSFPFFSDRSIQEITNDIASVLKNGKLSNGPKVQEFEKEFCRYTGATHAVAVNSGGSSLEIALRYFGVKEREVIVPTNTFVATPNSVLFAGGKPVFADIREDTLCVDPEDIRKRISSKTAGIIVVHIAGLVCPQINEIKKICKDNNLFLIEDCAHAHGASIDGKKAGTLGDAGCFSFAPTKVITTGEGGLLLTNDSELAEKARYMRNRGLNEKNLMITLGHSWTMSEVDAILGIHQLKDLDYFVEKRNLIAKKYESYLNKQRAISLIKIPPNITHSYHKFPVRLEQGCNSEKVISILKGQFGIETGLVYYPPCHLHPFYVATLKTGKGDCPEAEKTMKHIICLPIHININDSQVKYISNSLIHAMEKSKAS